MEETRITGRLPQLDLEIRTGRDPEAGAEWLTLRMRAVPSFETAARLFDPAFWWRAALAWNPWLGWLRRQGPLHAADAAAPRLGADGTTERPAGEARG